MLTCPKWVVIVWQVIESVNTCLDHWWRRSVQNYISVDLQLSEGMKLIN